MEDFNEKLASVFEKSNLKTKDKLINFTRFVNRRDLATLLNRYEIYKNIINIHGSVIECGVNLGSGLFSWLHFASILEPYNSSRHVVGFDTFEGFMSVTNEDEELYNKDTWREFTSKQSYDEIISSVETQNINRPLNHLDKVEVVKGDATSTIPNYLDKNPHLLIALLHLDFDIYSPTKTALENFLPRMTKGSIIAFDELNAHGAPGETLAFIESLEIKKFKLNRNVFDSYISYIVIE